MRILYSHYIAVDQHPALTMVEAIAAELRRLGHEVRVHRSRGAPGEQRPPGGREGAPGLLRRLRRRLWFGRELARNLPMLARDRAVLSAFRPDLVLARQDAYCGSMAVAAGLAGLPLVTYADAPVAYEARCFGGVHWHPPQLVESLERAVLARSRAVITVSEPARRRLVRYGLPVAVHAISNGVHADRFPSLSPAERAARRAALGLRAPLVLGFQGSFKAFHGIPRLRELMRWSAGRDDIVWLLIGDGPERAGLERAVAGVPAVFLGRQPPERMGALLSLIDIAVAPHQELAGDFYFCPLKILEYGAAGCAILASAQGDIPRLLDDGRGGLLLTEDSSLAWQQGLARLLDDAALRTRLAERARAFVQGNLTWRHTAERVAGVLEGCV